MGLYNMDNDSGEIELLDEEFDNVYDSILDEVYDNQIDTISYYIDNYGDE